MKYFETIIVADGSRELYEEIQELISSIPLPNPKVISTTVNIGASGSRNMGARVATTDILAFVDDDVILDESWVRRVVGLFEGNKEISALVGKTSPLWSNIDDSWLPTSLYWIVSCTGWFREDFHEVRNMWTMNAAVRRHAFSTCGGFRNELGPHKGREAGYTELAEDLEFSLRMREAGFKIFFAPSVSSQHHVQHAQSTLKYIVKRSLWIGRTRRMLARLHVKPDVEQRLLIGTLRSFGDQSVGKQMGSLLSATRKVMAVISSVVSIGIGFMI